MREPDRSPAGLPAGPFKPPAELDLGAPQRQHSSVTAPNAGEDNTVPVTHHSDFVSLFAAEAPDYSAVMTQLQVDRCMHEVGVDIVLEEIARGTLPNMLALRYKVPIIKFMDWLKRALPAYAAEKGLSSEAVLNNALALAADSLGIKSLITLQQNPINAQQATMMRAYAKRAAEVAALLSPDKWGVTKTDTGGMGGNNVTITIGGGYEVPGLGSGVTIEGRTAQPDEGE